MSAYLNLKTAVKLVVSFSLVLAIFLGLLQTSLWRLQNLQESQRHLSEEVLDALLTLKDLSIDINVTRGELQRVVLMEDPTLAAAQKDRLVANWNLTRQRLNNLSLDWLPSARTPLAELDQVWNEFHQERHSQVMPALEGGRFDDAKRLLNSSAEKETVARIHGLTRQLSQLVEADIDATLRTADTQLQNQRLLAVWGSLAGLVLTAFLIWLTTRAIATPLSQLTLWANRIAQGELDQKDSIPPRNDEVGQLNQAFIQMGCYLNNLALNAQRIATGRLEQTLTVESDKDVLGNAFVDMEQYLRALADDATRVASGDLTQAAKTASEGDVLGNAFATMVANLRRLVGELREGITVLATASQEILASTSQVAGSSQETATSISEITTTVEEVKQTALVAAERAHNTTEAAKRTVQVSRDGGRVVERTLEGMNQIRDQMQTVAQSILRLSEQTQSVGEVVAAVNDLAEQSNLLGVNASIEAVKAGEVGRGFSVVAQEVKTLADQSKQATAQVRTILGEVQKAMNKTVLAVEQSSKVVDQGYEQSQQLGNTIRQLSESIYESSDVALQIATSSQQQLAGMDQVVVAMESIRQASQDNVAGVKMTEQAARNLHELGQKLRQQAGQFRV